MTKLLPFIIAAFFWAWMTQASTRGKYGVHQQTSSNCISFFLLVMSLVIPVALRYSYNDTGTYIKNFQAAQSLSSLLQSGELHLLQNPLFQIYESLIRSFTSNSVIFFFFPAVYVQYSYLRFIRRHSPSFLMGIGLYFFLGTYVFSLAAMKQVCAMATLLYAVDALIDRKAFRFYLLVFVATLLHTYALLFVILPLFTVKPWSPRTVLMLLGIVFIMFNFESVISTFLDVASESGKDVSASELIGTASINPLRIAVYGVTPLFALVFYRYIFARENNREYNIIVNMSVITTAIMSLGLVSGANMFARMGQYFEFGVICGLPWMLTKPFEKNSERLVTLIAMVCFAGYFYYATAIWMPFDDSYARYAIPQFLGNLFREQIFS